VKSASNQPPGPRHGRAASSEAVEDYVRAILRTARGPRRVASTTAVAQFLNVTPASVSSMFKKLARLELVSYVPYHGATLTPAGERLALVLTRRHRLLQTFLTDVLGMEPELVHAEADRLEHRISPALEELIAAHLDERSGDVAGSGGT
jgi:DtxR family Mn-dependent transcriptional regulator